MALAQDGRSFRRSLPESSGFVVKHKHTFIEVVSPVTDGAPIAEGLGGRRACSDSALFEMCSKEERRLKLHSRAAETGQDVEFEITGLSDTDTNSEVQEVVGLPCYQHVHEEQSQSEDGGDLGTGTGTGTATGSRTPSNHGDDPLYDCTPWHGDCAFACFALPAAAAAAVADPSAAPTAATSAAGAGDISLGAPANSGCATGHDAVSSNMEMLLSENARLAQENKLLREKAALMGKLPEVAAPFEQNDFVRGISKESAADSAASEELQFSPKTTRAPPAWTLARQAGGPGPRVGGHAERGGGNGNGGQRVSRAAVQEDSRICDVPLANRTTVMLRNLPNNYSRAMVLAMLDGEGFSGAYDFVYLPIDFNSKACLGYAFVDLAHPSLVQTFWNTFDGFSKWILPSRKVCRVSWSGPHQGFEAHIARYRNSPVMHDSVPDEFKPVVFKDGVRIVFPGSSKAPRAPRVRHRPGAGGDAAKQHWSATRAAGW